VEESRRGLFNKRTHEQFFFGRKLEVLPFFQEKGGLDESNPDMRKIKTVQLIDIIKKVGLMNQAPT